jgi:hypothetical protein
MKAHLRKPRKNRVDIQVDFLAVELDGFGDVG